MVWHKKVLMMDLFLTNRFLFCKSLTDGLEWRGLLWCFNQLFGLSFWRHPFTTEYPLVSKWSNATFLQICSDEEKLIYILDGLMWVHLHQISIFRWSIPLTWTFYLCMLSKGNMITCFSSETSSLTSLMQHTANILLNQ